MENTVEKPVENSEGKMTPEKLKAAFMILLKLSGGMVIPDAALNSVPKDAEFSANYDTVNKLWHIFVFEKRQRKIIKLKNKSTIIQPDKRIFVPT